MSVPNDIVVLRKYLDARVKTSRIADLTNGEWSQQLGLFYFMKWLLQEGTPVATNAMAPKVIKRKGEKPFAGVQAQLTELPVLEWPALLDKYILHCREEDRKAVDKIIKERERKAKRKKKS